MNDKNIKIEGLLASHLIMLDEMWAIQSFEEYEEWLSELSYQDRIVAEDLQRLLIIEVADQMLQEDLSVAKNLLKKFQLGK